MSVGTPCVDVSVVICTFNRSADLAGAVESVVRQDAVDFSYEVIIVDNGSTDDTKAVVERLARAHPVVRYLCERHAGLSHARNAGYQTAHAPVVAFLDDDAVAEPGWLHAAVNAFRAAPPDVGVIGGRIIPVWEAPQPGWLTDRPALCLTMLDWSDVPREICDLRIEWLAGANMAVRRHLIAEVGGFHPALGRAGSRNLSSEDIFLQRQLQRAGVRLLYDPAMSVRHRVPAARLTQAWFRRRHFWQGVSDAVMHIIDETPSSSARLRDALARSRALLRRGPALLDLVRSHDDPARFEQVCWMWIECGYVVGLLGAGRV